MAGRTLFDKIWDRHVIAELGDGYALLHVSRHLMHDGGAAALERNRLKGYTVRAPELTFATMDHAVTTEPGRTRGTRSQFVARLDSMREECRLAGVQLFGSGSTYKVDSGIFNFSGTVTLASIDAAIQGVSDARSSFGSIQNRIEHTLNNLANYEENLTAANSRIKDVDMASEMVNFTKLQVLQQAGTSMLAQANQAPQSVLSLLR